MNILWWFPKKSWEISTHSIFIKPIINIYSIDLHKYHLLPNIHLTSILIDISILYYLSRRPIPILSGPFSASMAPWSPSCSRRCRCHTPCYRRSPGSVWEVTGKWHLIYWYKIFHYKPSILGHHHFRKSSYVYMYILYIYIIFNVWKARRK